jgi:UDP-glucose 4-epimerase
MEKNKILVTGGAGYIGSHTIIELLEKGRNSIISADNFRNSSDATFRRIKKITGVEIPNYPIDLCVKADVQRLFEENKDTKAIIHFAALKSVPESVAKPLEYYHNNIESIVTLLEMVSEYKIPYFIFSSSCSVYGSIEKLPVNEETPLTPAMSPYGYSKQIGEQMLKDFSVSYPATKFIALRYFNPVGAHPSGFIGEVPLQQPNNLVPIITRTAAGIQEKVTVYGDDYNTRDGTCVRDYVHVSDIARAHIDALKYLEKENDTPSFSLYNLGTGEGVTVLEMLKAFERVSGKRLNYTIGARRAGDVPAIYSDSGKAKKYLNWAPIHSLNEMMSSAWQWEQNLQFKI